MERTCIKCNKVKKHYGKGFCYKCYLAEYYQKNKIRIDGINKLYYLKNKERIRLYNREYGKENRDHLKEVKKEWEENNKDKLRLYRQLKEKKHPEKIKARKRITYLVNKGKIPNIKTQICLGCGEKAESYHHYLGYNKENWNDIVPLCYKCHNNIHNSRGPKAK